MLVLGLNPDPLEEHPVLLTDELFLQLSFLEVSKEAHLFKTLIKF